MNADTIVGMIIISLCTLLCAVIFYGIGIWASKRKDPMHFYSGTTVDPQSLSDVTAYNFENAKMWKSFSVPFWLGTLCSVISFWDNRFSAVSIALLIAGSTVGTVWLVWKYQRILKEYSIR